LINFNVIKRLLEFSALGYSTSYNWSGTGLYQLPGMLLAANELQSLSSELVWRHYDAEDGHPENVFCLLIAKSTLMLF
jgi:hypothetical protein